MIHLDFDTPVAKTDLDKDRARQRITNIMQAAAAQLQDTGLADDRVRLFRKDPHRIELDLRDAVAGLARGLLVQAFATTTASTSVTRSP